MFVLSTKRGDWKFCLYVEDISLVCITDNDYFKHIIVTPVSNVNHLEKVKADFVVNVSKNDYISHDGNFIEIRTCNDIHIELSSEYDELLSKAMTHNDSIQEMMAFGFTFEESENIVNGLNPDGSPKE